MKFLIDENVDQRIAERLIAEGFNVRQVSSIAPGASDEAILQISIAENEIVITDDKDFGELAFRRAKSSCGVMLLRLRGLSSEVRGSIVSNVVKDMGIVSRTISPLSSLTEFVFGANRKPKCPNLFPLARSTR
ncbi:MAG: DUF5615 family PIN-like protein [Chloroherpetonaceae bacterium]|nr:DUF5615 family PIN-like protein [Chloroherpetonaceae bacterium]MDW8438106.1 DUF5615 family PIN-like protein [Chloroherpetonaceae bacterium]